MKQIPITDTREMLYDDISMREVMDDVRLFGPRDVPVIITGANGTGKENIARMLHNESNRATQPFIAINCAAISPGLIESELFGHEKGSFTGASGKRIGAFEAAKEGTLFLDEIGEMPAEMQTKLLRVLEDGEFSRVGSNDTIVARPRIISATNRDIEKAVQEGKLREDLYYRLRGMQINVPDLKDRANDIPMLARHYANQTAIQYDLPPPEITEDAMAELLEYSWPGNVRELKSRITEATIRAHEDGYITPELLKLDPKHIGIQQTSDGTPIEDTFGYKLNQHRESRGWTQTQLTKQVNIKSGNQYSRRDVEHWEANFAAPDSDALAALSYLLIIDNPHIDPKDKASKLRDFMDTARISETMVRRQQDIPPEDNFGQLIKKLREDLNLTASELAAKASDINDTTYLTQKDLYLIENAHPRHVVTSKEVLALVKALDQSGVPLSEQEKVELYERAKQTFKTTIASATPSQSHTQNGANDNQLDQIQTHKKQIRELFVNAGNNEMTLDEIATLSTANQTTLSKLLGRATFGSEVSNLKAGGALSDNTLIKLENALMKMGKEDKLDTLREAFDELRGLVGHRGYSQHKSGGQTERS
jgi:transcriptional regulator with AAA-type ATPase domain